MEGAASTVSAGMKHVKNVYPAHQNQYRDHNTFNPSSSIVGEAEKQRNCMLLASDMRHNASAADSNV
jgi:hypothetical protein